MKSTILEIWQKIKQKLNCKKNNIVNNELKGQNDFPLHSESEVKEFGNFDQNLLFANQNRVVEDSTQSNYYPIKKMDFSINDSSLLFEQDIPNNTLELENIEYKLSNYESHKKNTKFFFPADDDFVETENNNIEQIKSINLIKKGYSCSIKYLNPVTPEILNPVTPKILNSVTQDVLNPVALEILNPVTPEILILKSP